MVLMRISGVVFAAVCTGLSAPIIRAVNVRIITEMEPPEGLVFHGKVILPGWSAGFAPGLLQVSCLKHEQQAGNRHKWTAVYRASNLSGICSQRSAINNTGAVSSQYYSPS